MPDSLDDFQKTRSELNEEILNCGHLGMKRFFALDHHHLSPGAVRRGGLAPRGGDRRTERGPGRGGSIAIPHVRRAFARMREIQGLQAEVE